MEDYFLSFRREKDGIWVCLEPVTVFHPNGRLEIAPGQSLRKGTLCMGVDLAAWLDEQLMNLLTKRSSNGVARDISTGAGVAENHLERRGGQGK
jgi:hypothetical protein